MSFIKDFKEFAMRGNVVDMAVGVIVGGAFGKIVTSLVNDLIMPVMTVVTGNNGFANMKYVIKEGADGVEAVAINYGMFIQNVVDFFIIALSIFVALRVMMKFRRKEQAQTPAAPVEPAKTEEVELLTEIRDLLRNKDK